MSIFKAYDIRGEYPKELNEKLAYKIGAAFGTFIKGNIAVGCDVRLSSPKLKKALIKGILSAGSDVMDVGIVSSPLLSFAIINKRLAGGIMITASHNPPKYNGFKLYGERALPYSYEAGICKIEELVKNEKFNKGKGKVIKANILKKYIDFIVGKFKFKKKIRVVVDASNGVAGLSVPKIFEKLGLEVEKLYCDPDGNFPNHLPDNEEPGVFRDLSKKVKETNADLGFFYDGDADRVSVVDENGRRILDNHIFALLAKDLLKKLGEKVVYDVSCSRVVEDLIKESNGIPIICRVGHTYIHEKIKEVNAVFGGETSGHYFFRETQFIDDALFASLKLIEILITSGKKISELVGALPRYYYNVIKVPKAKRFEWVDNLKEKLKSYKIIDIDGVKVLFDYGWVLVRPSNTEPIIRVAWEGKTKANADKLKEFIKEKIYPIS